MSRKFDRCKVTIRTLAYGEDAAPLKINGVGSVDLNSLAICPGPCQF
jgi:hypothetical protein